METILYQSYLNRNGTKSIGFVMFFGSVFYYIEGVWGGAAPRAGSMMVPYNGHVNGTMATSSIHSDIEIERREM